MKNENLTFHKVRAVFLGEFCCWSAKILLNFQRNMFLSREFSSVFCQILCGISVGCF